MRKKTLIVLALCILLIGCTSTETRMHDPVSYQLSNDDEQLPVPEYTVYPSQNNGNPTADHSFTTQQSTNSTDSVHQTNKPGKTAVNTENSDIDYTSTITPVYSTALPSVYPTSTPTSDLPTATDTATATAIPTAMPTAMVRSDYPYLVNNIASLSYQYNTELQTRPIWYGNVIYNETLVFVENDDKSINAKLLFDAVKILSVRDWTFKELTQGVHWDWDVQNPGVIRFLKGNSLYTTPYITQNQLNGNVNESGCYKMGNALFCLSEFLVTRQLQVSYVYNETDSASIRGEYKGSLLQNTVKKLKSGILNFAVYGDDTVINYNASLGVNSKIGSLADNLAGSLQNLLNSKAVKAVEDHTYCSLNCSGIVESDIKRLNLDLAIISFGMNDPRVEPDEFKIQIEKLMQWIIKENPNCEFIIITSLKINPAAELYYAYPKSLDAIKSLEKEGVAVIDFYSVVEKLSARKSSAELYSDNVRWCSDFTARLCAMYVLSAIYDYTLVK